MMISPPHRNTTRLRATLLSLIGLALGGGGTPAVLEAQDTDQSRGSLADPPQAKAEAERLYEPVRHVDPVTRARSIDLVIRGYDAGGRSVPCTNGDSADILIALRWVTTPAKQELLIYAISVGRTWHFLDAMRLLIDDWLLTPRQAAAPSLELVRQAQGVIETSAYEVTRRQLVLMARAKTVQIRLIGGGGLCDLTLGPVGQELIGLFLERELGSSPRAAGSGALGLGQAQRPRVTARIRSTSTSNGKGLAR